MKVMIVAALVNTRYLSNASRIVVSRCQAVRAMAILAATKLLLRSKAILARIERPSVNSTMRCNSHGVAAGPGGLVQVAPARAGQLAEPGP